MRNECLEFATVKRFECRRFERWVVRGLHSLQWSWENWEHGNVENKNKRLVECQAFVDSVGLKRADLEDEFFF